MERQEKMKLSTMLMSVMFASGLFAKTVYVDCKLDDYSGADGRDWTVQVESSLPKEEIDFFRFPFAKPGRVRFWRFTAKSSHYHEDLATLAEIRLVPNANFGARH